MQDTPKMPQARRRGLIVEELQNEILIYDEDRDKALCLNQTAANVWKYCDGQTTVAAACNKLSSDLKAPVDEKLLWYAIDQFEKDDLLEDTIQLPPAITAGMSRRQLARTLGLAAVVAIPLVTSIVAPTAAHAASCVASGQPCTSSPQCCSGLCSGGTCA
jgi:hypothetical protein